MPIAESFHVSMVGWKLIEPVDGQIVWVNEGVPDVRIQRYGRFPPTDLPPDYPNIESHRAMFERMMNQSQGAVISVDFLKVKGIEAFQTIFKFHMPENSLGMRYLGSVMFPFMNCFCGFTFQCDEYGTTGTREALSYMVESRLNPQPPEAPPPPVQVSSMEGFFDKIRNAPVRRLPSDDEQYDSLVPTHPLTRTRRYLKELVETIEFDDEVRSTAPYRGINNR